ncbi:MAG: hypothetical protein VB095_07645, partial [Anaerovorax sp.]|nr:hypothetical protein [Anaerovorax sp.]
MIAQNKLIQRGIFILLTITLLITGFFIAPNRSFAVTKTEIITKTETINDLAYYDIWKHADGTWQKDIKQGSFVSARFTIPADVIPKRGTFISCSGKFNKDYNDDEYRAWSVISGNLSGNSSYNSTEKSVTYTVNTILKTNTGINGRDITNSGQLDEVEGYRYYIPVIIEITYSYMVETTVGDFEPGLNVPSSAKNGESYNVSDASVVDNDDTIDYAVLDRHYGDGSWKNIIIWDGTGKAGENTGGQITESYNKEGVIFYRLTVYDTYGQVKEIRKTINIIDGSVVDATVILSLPEFTYEGHPVIAEDESTYVVDGEDYSALRAYEEGKASNRFSILESGAGSIRKNSTPIYATATFPNKGYYNVQLKISPKNSGSLYDVKPIEVLKTPTVLARLGGTQKQNRKQVLNIQVATNPQSPLKRVWAEVTNLETGETVHLDHNIDEKENELDNTDGIKTRPIEKLESDQYWTNCQLLFLTKNTKPEKFRYKVYAQDSRGLWDEIEKEFTIQPDLPPDAKISVQDAFFREKGTNTAKIEMEDVSSSDGDQLERTWYITEDSNVDESFKGEIEEKAEKKAGFTDNSFGTKKIISVNKIGVGKVRLRLHVKDVWTEETLPEYITDADYLTADTTAITKVDNIAPVVSLKPLTPRTADILLLAGNTEEYYKLKNGINTMQSYFLGNAIDANITVKKLGKPFYTDKSVDRYKHIYQESMGGAIGYTDAEIVGYAVDDEYLYLINCGLSVNQYGLCTFLPPYTLKAIDLETEKNVWSYTFDNNTFPINFYPHGVTKEIIQFDSEDQYIYVVRNGKTLLLDRSTGAHLTTLNLEVGKRNYLEGNYIYTLKDDGIYMINRKTGDSKKVIKTNATKDAVCMIESEIHF